MLSQNNNNYIIAEGRVEVHRFITCTYNKKTKEYFMEYYSGENYIVSSTERSYSRIYKESKIPAKYRDGYLQLKEIVNNSK